MKVWLNRVPLYLALTAVSDLMGGCGLFGGGSDTANVQPSPQPVATQTFPTPKVQVVTAPSKVALVRPTNPDDRLRVIRSGRNDPFNPLVSPPVKATSGSGGGSSGAAKSNKAAEKVGDRIATSYDKFLERISDSYSKSGSGTAPGSSSGSGSVNLPTLPKQPEPAGVKVLGVALVAGMPRAIVQAPNEPTSRTVGVGESLSGGQLFVKDIDMSNRTEPTVIFQQGSLQFSVAVGRDPVMMASAGPGAAQPVSGLYSLQAP
jgi:hypothetical protein